VWGGSAGDLLAGMGGNDALNGAAGNDTLSGGAGIDTLTGGSGNDLFVFDTTLSSSTNVDVITDLAAGDFIALDNDIFAALGSAGALAAGQFYSGAGLTGANVVGQTAGVYYNTTTGGLYYDVDGFGGVAGVQFATLGSKPVLSAAAFVMEE